MKHQFFSLRMILFKRREYGKIISLQNEKTDFMTIADNICCRSAIQRASRLLWYNKTLK